MSNLRIAAGLAVLAGLSMATAAHAAHAAEPPPVAAFARMPAVESVDISPDGRRLALLGGPAGARTLAIATIDVDELSRAFSIHVRGKAQKRWTVLERGEDIDSAMGYVGYSDPDDAVYLRQGGEGGERIVLKSLNGEAVTPVGQPTPGATPGLLFDPYRGVAVAVVGGAERPQIQWLDEELGQVHAVLSRAFKDRHVSLHDWSSDRGRFIVRVDGPGAPPAWLLFDKAGRALSPLGEAYPELEGVALGPTRWITYTARDGLEIGAYLTLPPAELGAARAPLVVLPHGGPGSRDEFAFDFLVQSLASRGYAVLRPQFRGSKGFGRAFYEAGRAEWGGKMQTDLLDAIAAVTPLAEVDAERACIVGWSFGGYAALAGVSLHPGRYRCAASIAGISDLKLLLAQQGGVYGRESASFHALRRMLGRNGPNSPELVTTSPLRQVANINVPVLLVHGEQDTIVEPVQSAVLAAALKAQGGAVEHLVLSGDDHYLRRPQSRSRLLTALEGFLAEHLPVRP